MLEILMIEDDVELAEILGEYLKNHDMNVTSYDEPYTGMSAVNAKKFDLLLLDLTLPNLDGLEVCERVIKQKNIPIIISSARNDVNDKIKALELGADDYIPKPFSPKILLYKIAAIFRRGSSDTQKQTSIVYKDLCMDIDGFHLYHKGKEIVLTQKEFSLLRLMLENKGKVFTRQMLLDRLWDSETFVEDRIVDSHIKNIRKKLDADYIETIRGVGYRIDKEN